MARIATIILLILAAIPMSASGFGKWCSDSTLRLDIAIPLHGPRQSISIDALSKMPGWYGRRVNMAEFPYRGTVEFVMADLITGDTIYHSSKYAAMGYGGHTDFSSVTLMLPMPKRGAELSATYWRGPNRVTDRIAIPASWLAQTPVRGSQPHYGYETLHAAENPAEAVYIAIVAEGYTADRMPLFLEHARRTADTLLHQGGFADRADRINIIAVKSPSAENGISRPSKDEFHDTLLHSFFDSQNLDRIIIIPDDVEVIDITEGTPAEYVMVLANTETYGGSGPWNDYAIGYAGGEWSPEVIVHEFGHSFANLGDEYESGYVISYTPDVEPEEPNITTLCDFSGKWQQLIDEGKASLIEGAGYQSRGVWRGCDRCLMRAVADKHFCPVCARAIALHIDFLTIPRPAP